MGRPRLIDYDECRALYEAGDYTLAALGRRYGVTATSVARVVNEECGARERAWAALRFRLCVDCGRRVSFNAVRCGGCSDLKKATTVRPDALRCATCREWKPDAAFAKNRAGKKARRGRHEQCRPCNTATKRAWRERQTKAAA